MGCSNFRSLHPVLCRDGLTCAYTRKLVLGLGHQAVELAPGRVYHLLVLAFAVCHPLGISEPGKAVLNEVSSTLHGVACHGHPAELGGCAEIVVADVVVGAVHGHQGERLPYAVHLVQFVYEEPGGGRTHLVRRGDQPASFMRLMARSMSTRLVIG